MKKVILAVLTVFTVSSVLFAVTPAMNIQGRLTDQNGVNKLDDNYSLIFSIWDGNGDELWAELQDNVAVRNGVFQVLLGEGIPDLPDNPDLLEVFTGDDRWLEIQVESDPALVPRQKITSVGYAFNGFFICDTDAYGNE